MNSVPANQEITNTYAYAHKHNYIITQPNTWEHDELFKKRLQKLAKIIPKAHKELDDLSEIISKQNKNLPAKGFSNKRVSKGKK